MDGEKRREILLKILKDSEKPVSGGSLARELGVSRQVIVQDVALLRAAGEDVMATPQGYVVISRQKGRPRRVFAVQHNEEEIEEELSIIINHGGTVLDVIVEHPLYGELCGLLMMSSLGDLHKYLDKYRSAKAQPLSALTKGVHLHTVEADDWDKMDMIEQHLLRRGFLLSKA